MTDTKVSVIIPTLNGGEILIKVCKALIQQVFQNRWEVVIIDSKSSDGSIRLVKDLFSNSKIPLRLITIDRKDFQHGRTRNQAIQQCRGEIVLLLTQDSVPVQDDWLYTMYNAFENSKIAGVFGRHIAYDSHPKLIHRDLDLHFERMNEMQVRKIDDWDEYQNNISLKQTLHFFSNNNSGLRKSIWEKIPFPDVDYGEDQTWAMKVLEDGYSLSYKRESIVRHSHNFNFKNLIKRHSTEIQYFEKEFGYNLRIDRKKMISMFLKNIMHDLLWLIKNKEVRIKEVSYLLKKNISSIFF